MSESKFTPPEALRPSSIISSADLPAQRLHIEGAVKPENILSNNDLFLANLPDDEAIDQIASAMAERGISA